MVKPAFPADRLPRPLNSFVRHTLDTELETSPMNSTASDSDSQLEREKWEVERAFREREVSLAERQFQIAQEELALKHVEQASGRWRSPLVVAIFAAAVAGAGNALVSYITADSQTRLEAQKAEQARILEVIKTGSADKAAANLGFLLDAGLIRDMTLRTDLQAYLAKRPPGLGPALPAAPFSAKDAQELVSKFEGVNLKPYKDPLGKWVIGAGHLLSDSDVARGSVRIGNEDVPFATGISEAQSRQLLGQDLQPIRAKVKELVAVPLTPGQEDALTSLVYQIGLGNFKSSSLLKKLNEGKYDEVPKEMMRWTKVGGVTLQGLTVRRDAETALWRRP